MVSDPAFKWTAFAAVLLTAAAAFGAAVFVDDDASADVGSFPRFYINGEEVQDGGAATVVVGQHLGITGLFGNNSGKFGTIAVNGVSIPSFPDSDAVPGVELLFSPQLNMLSGDGAPSQTGAYVFQLALGSTVGTYTLNVVSELVPTNSPRAGIIIMPVKV